MLREKVNNERGSKDYEYCPDYRGWDVSSEEKCKQTIQFLWCYDCPRSGVDKKGVMRQGGGDVV